MSPADLAQMAHALERLLSAGTSLPGRLPLKDHQERWSAFRRASGGGKRCRPALLLSTHRALGGLRPAAAVQVAAAIELLHTAFVVQDDVIDEDQLRRGAPSLPRAFAARARAPGATAAGARRSGAAAGLRAGGGGVVAPVAAVWPGAAGRGTGLVGVIPGAASRARVTARASGRRPPSARRPGRSSGTCAGCGRPG